MPRASVREYFSAFSWRRHWAWALVAGGLLLKILGARGLGGFVQFVGVAALLVQAGRWIWEKLLFRVSRRLWLILVLLAVVPVAALHVFFASLAWLGLGGQVSRSVQGNIRHYEEALRQASEETSDRVAIQQVRLLGDAWARRTDRLPEGIQPDFVGLVLDKDPKTGVQEVVMRSVNPEGKGFRLLSLNLGRLTDRTRLLWGGRMHFKVTWSREEKHKTKSGQPRPEDDEDEETGAKTQAPAAPKGAVLQWSKGEPLQGGGLFKSFKLPPVGQRMIDWQTGRPLVLTATPETSLAELFQGYGFTNDPRNLPEQSVVAMAAVAGILFLLGCAQLFALWVGMRLALRLGKSVDGLHTGVRQLARGDFSARIRPLTKDQVGQLARDFNDMARQLEASLRERDLRMSLEEELRVAREVQMRLLPNLEALKLPTAVFATILPAKEVAGDYYDVMKLPDGSLAFLIADVSGKGTSAAFYAAETKGVMAALDKLALSPLEVVARLNDIWCQTHPRGVFMTLVYGVFHPGDGRFSFVRAGHPAAFVRRAQQGDAHPVERLHPRGIGVGLCPDARFEASLALCEGRLEPGEALVFYTDGLSEAQNLEGDHFGEARIQQALAQPAMDLKLHLLSEVMSFTGDEHLTDDLTLLILAR